MAQAHGIEAEGLVRTFKGDIRAVDGIDLRVEPGEIYGFLGPERRGQVDDGAHADDAPAPHLGHGARCRLRHRQGRAEGAHRHRRRASGSRARQPAHGPRAPQAPVRAARDPPRRAPRPLAGAARAGRADARGRPQGRRLLGRDEAQARPRARARAPADDPLPRRADDRSRRTEPKRALERGRTAGAGGRRHGLPDHAVPRGGRRARRPRRDHRPRSHRRRGHARES